MSASLDLKKKSKKYIDRYEEFEAISEIMK